MFWRAIQGWAFQRSSTGDCLDVLISVFEDTLPGGLSGTWWTVGGSRSPRPASLADGDFGLTIALVSA